MFYFNDESIEIEMMKEWLTLKTEKYGLSSDDWKLPFKMICSRPENWMNDFFKKVDFALEK